MVDGALAMVTGAGSGIGRAVAVALAADGWRPVLVGRDRDRLEETAAAALSVADTPVPALVLPADVRRPDEVAAAVAAAEASGPVDALVTSAGVQRLALALAVTEADWDDVLDTNLKGAFLCAQAVGRAMTARGRGAIVHVSSAAGSIAVAERTAYAAAKAGLNMLTRSLAAEWGPAGVRVNAVAPTFVDTDMGRLTLADPARREQIEARIPLRRIASLHDVVQAVRFLVDPDRSGFVTGQVLGIDGGLTL